MNNSQKLALTRLDEASHQSGSQCLIDIPTLAIQLGVTTRFVRRLIAERRIPFLKIGKFIRFDPSEVEQWKQECRVGG